MALVRWKKQDVWDPFEGLFDLQRQMNRVFSAIGGSIFGGESLFSQPGFPAPTQERWLPAIEVSETKDRVIVRAELPGIKKEELEISIDSDALVLKGERKQETRVEKDGLFKSEMAYGAFQRLIELPATVDAQGAKATYKDGVLEVRLTKVAQAPGKQLDVEWN